MRERQRRRPNDEPRNLDHTGAGGAGDEIDRLRSENDELLNNADAAIARGMSVDSRAFLRANRQGGGQ